MHELVETYVYEGIKIKIVKSIGQFEIVHWHNHDKLQYILIFKCHGIPFCAVNLFNHQFTLQKMFKIVKESPKFIETLALLIKIWPKRHISRIWTAWNAISTYPINQNFSVKTYSVMVIWKTISEIKKKNWKLKSSSTML